MNADKKNADVEDLLASKKKCQQTVNKLNENSLVTEENLINTQLIQAQEEAMRLKGQSDEAFERMMAKPYLRSMFKGIRSIEKILAHLKATNQVRICLGIDS